MKSQSGARYYDPRTGRFLSEDPIGLNSKDFNLYRYASNSPLGYIDPDGLYGRLVLAFASGLVATWLADDMISGIAPNESMIIPKPQTEENRQKSYRIEKRYQEENLYRKSEELKLRQDLNKELRIVCPKVEA